MERVSLVSMQQMKDAFGKLAGSKFPVKVVLLTGEAMVRYIRGFADQQSSIVLISETSYSLAMKIVEVKEIAALEFTREDNGGWVRLNAKWSQKTERL